MRRIQSWFDDHSDIGILCLRLFIGIRLVYGVIDNILSWEKMLEFADFLEKFQFPFTVVSAVVSVYAQFIAGIFILFGFNIRLASFVMIVNFLIALIMVHREDSFEGMTSALAILFSSILFLFQGAGKFSVDHKFKK